MFRGLRRADGMAGGKKCELLTDQYFWVYRLRFGWECVKMDAEEKCAQNGFYIASLLGGECHIHTLSACFVGSFHLICVYTACKFISYIIIHIIIAATMPGHYNASGYGPITCFLLSLPTTHFIGDVYVVNLPIWMRREEAATACSTKQVSHIAYTKHITYIQYIQVAGCRIYISCVVKKRRALRGEDTKIYIIGS